MYSHIAHLAVMPAMWSTTLVDCVITERVINETAHQCTIVAFGTVTFSVLNETVCVRVCRRVRRSDVQTSYRTVTLCSRGYSEKTSVGYITYIAYKRRVLSVSHYTLPSAALTQPVLVDI